MEERRGPNRDGGQTMKANLALINAKGTSKIMRHDHATVRRDTYYPKVVTILRMIAFVA